MDILPGQAVRLPLFLFGLLTLLSWELARPHHAAKPRRLGRWLENLALAGINGGVITAVCYACFFVSAQGWAPWRLGSFQALQGTPLLRIVLEIAALDLLVYWVHRGYHALPFLWRFHAVHHTDVDLDVSTASRFHLGEVATSGVAKLAAFTLLGISPIGLVAFECAMLLAAQFQHANVPLPAAVERVLWWLLVPPAMHRLHHYPERRLTDSNYGTILTVWDRLFGSLRHGDRPPEFGIEGEPEPRPRGVGRLLAYPLHPHGRPPRRTAL
jgi:sterol desaturase/sphingolipid hydroxylase (fatty acid hydroxylase superfamily)